MPLTAGTITITVPSPDPNSGLGTPNLIGSPPSPNLAKELAQAFLPDEMSVDGASKMQDYYNNLASILIAHIVANGFVTGEATVITAPGIANVVGTIT